MPFLRVIRDKRGYETTYLMHWIRDGARQRSRILYVFRSPGGIRVGREALEPDVLRQIESQHPDIEFDWSAVFHNQQVIETAPEQRRTRKRPPAEASPQNQPPPQAPPAPRFAVPGAIEGATPDEQIAFLAKWYEAVRARIPQRAPDQARQDVLFALCERLNPAAWTDADQITAGLQQAGEALQRLSHVFAKRRRRSKKRSGAKPGGAEPASAAEMTDRSPDAPASDAAADVSEDVSDDLPDSDSSEPTPES